MATHAPPAPLEPLPPSLSSALGKLVYLAIRQRRETTVVELRDALDVPQLTLYPTLDALAAAELVEREGEAVRLADDAGAVGTGPVTG